MSTIMSPATEVAAAPSGVDRVRTALVSLLLAVGAVTVAAMVLWQPWGERDAIGYADLAPHRDTAWLGAILDGFGIVAVAIGLGLLVCRLARARGATLATVGALLTGVGGVAFCAGMISFGTLAWHATGPEIVPVDAGTSLLAFVEDNPGHAIGVQMAGFLSFTLGTLILMGALWRSRAVPRWYPVAFLVLTVAVFAAGGVLLNIVQAVQTLSLVVVAWYALRSR